MVLGALAGAEMAMRDVGIDLTLGSGVAAAEAHFRKTIMAKEKEPTEQERFAEIQLQSDMLHQQPSSPG